MNTPTISEAARRAARKYADQVAPLGSDANDWVRIIEQLTPIIKEALDSAHPAPKEGETPETDAVIDSLYNSKLNMAEILAKVEGHARSLELRLSEAKREVEVLSKVNEEWHNTANAHMLLIGQLRSHLKTANELLGRINGFVEDDHITPTLRNDIVAHLNQQRK